MRVVWKRVGIGAAVIAWSALAGASDLTIHLSGSHPLSRNTAKYQCDAQGAKMGLPAGIFSVEYINGAGNSLAIVVVGLSSSPVRKIVSAW